ncbi:MAG: tRNA dihydrouridine synthase [Salibacteraceae bacterium]
MIKKLISSPLQGFTDFRFRNAFHEIFGGIDTYYAPYIRYGGKLEVKSSYKRDLDPSNNRIPELIPQVMTAKEEEFLHAAEYVQGLGYTELNWNLGCPYPMACKKGMGSGLIHDASKIDAILNRVHNETDITVSMKMRMGYHEPTEILKVFPVLAKYPIKNIAIHARLGKQLYKGNVDLDAFEACLPHSEQPIFYNGDITSVESFRDRVDRFPTIDTFLIGRGLIADPFLPKMIKENTTSYPIDRWDKMELFHNRLFDEYDGFLQGTSHLISKMHNFWEYYSVGFENPKKVYKKIKKAKNIIQYKIAVKEIFNAEKEH